MSEFKFPTETVELPSKGFFYPTDHPLKEGKVEMKVNYALLDAEVKQGFILTCQSHAVSDTIVVDYDKGK